MILFVLGLLGIKTVGLFHVIQFVFVTWLQTVLTGNRLSGTGNAFCHWVAKCVTMDQHFVTFLTHFVAG